MPESGNERRNSRALEAPLIADPQARAAAEARNGLRQYDAGIKTIQTALELRNFKLRVSLILALHREALADISSYAGNFRPAGVEIEGSKHEPVGAHLVPELIEEMCDYVNDRWETEHAASPCRLCHVAAQLDSSFRRRQWPDIAHPFLCGLGDRGGRYSARRADHPRPDR